MTLSFAEYEFILGRDLMAFIERSFYELNPQTCFVQSPHIELLASKLEACRRGNIRRLIVNLPPRSLKSHAASVAYVAWLLGHDPSLQIICASYGQDLADKHARDCRTLMMSELYQRLFPQTRISSEKQSVSEFLTTAQGMRMSTSVGGVLTGRGADVIILDDPLKPDEAMSETRRTAVNDWYDNSLLSRLNSKETGIIIIIMQRLHQDDLVGHVLETGDWKVISLPAIAEEDEDYLIESPLGNRHFRRTAGDALQPERESRATLEAMRQTMGTYNFSSQYQQSPIPVGGSIVKSDWLTYYEELPARFFFVLQSWDTANKSGELNDFSVCTTWGVYERRYYLLHVFRKRLNYPDLKRAVAEQAREYKASSIVIEDKASGTQLIQDLRADGLFGVREYEPPAGMDKVLRLHAQSVHFENGRVLLPRSARWLDDYIRELFAFPGGKYDDQVDSTTQALEYLRTHRAREVWAHQLDQ